jgi:hypothetical protein
MAVMVARRRPGRIRVVPSTRRRERSGGVVGLERWKRPPRPRQEMEVEVGYPGGQRGVGPDGEVLSEGEHGERWEVNNHALGDGLV